MYKAPLKWRKKAPAGVNTFTLPMCVWCSMYISAGGHRNQPAAVPTATAITITISARRSASRCSMTLMRTSSGSVTRGARPKTFTGPRVRD